MGKLAKGKKDDTKKTLICQLPYRFESIGQRIVKNRDEYLEPLNSNRKFEIQKQVGRSKVQHTYTFTNHLYECMREALLSQGALLPVWSRA